MEYHDLQIMILIYLSHYHQILLKPQLLNKRLFSFGSLTNKRYKTKTGGTFYISNLYTPRVIGKKPNSKLKSGSTIFYLPQATIQTAVHYKKSRSEKHDDSECKQRLTI